MSITVRQILSNVLFIFYFSLAGNMLGCGEEAFTDDKDDSIAAELITHLTLGFSFKDDNESLWLPHWIDEDGPQGKEQPIIDNIEIVSNQTYEVRITTWSNIIESGSVFINPIISKDADKYLFIHEISDPSIKVTIIDTESFYLEESNPDFPVGLQFTLSVPKIDEVLHTNLRIALAYLPDTQDSKDSFNRFEKTIFDATFEVDIHPSFCEWPPDPCAHLDLICRVDEQGPHGYICDAP